MRNDALFMGAFVCLLFALIPCIAANGYASGNNDLRNGTVVKTGSGITVTEGALTNGLINFTGFVGEWFYWVHDNSLAVSELVSASTYQLNASVACTVWLVIDNGSAVVFRTNSAYEPNPMQLTAFGNFWYNVLGVAGYLLLVMLPAVSIWLYSGSSGAFAAVLLILGSTGVILLPDPVKPVVILPLALSISVLVYKLFGPKEP